MINDLLPKQQELMDKVPHDVTSPTLFRMRAGIGVIDTLLRFLNSTGHKPWRPIPLHPMVQDKLKKELKAKVAVLNYMHSTSYGVDTDLSYLAHYARQVVSGLGIIEETVEYLNTLNTDDTEEGGSIDRQHQLEEITDILFFYLESIILSGFTMDEIEQEYIRKHAVNLERYKRGKEGDWDWDKRDEGGL